MKPVIVSLLIALVFISCSSTPQQAPLWLDHEKEDSQYYYFTVEGSLDENNTDDIYNLLIEQVFQRLGFDLENADSVAFDEMSLLKESLLAVLQGDAEYPGFLLLESQEYKVDSQKWLALLASYEKDALEEKILQLLHLFPVDLPELDRLLDQAQQLEDQGYYGSAFFLYLDVAVMGRELGGVASRYLWNQNIQKARDNMDTWDFSDPTAPKETYSGEPFPNSFIWNIPLDPQRDEVITMAIYYPHPFDPQKQAMAIVRSDNTGRIEFNHPSLFIPGNYQLQIIPNQSMIEERDTLTGQFTQEDWDYLIQGHEGSLDYQLLWDIRRLPLAIYIRDLDVLGKPVAGFETARKLKDALGEQGVDVQILETEELPLSPESQIIREVQRLLPEDRVLLIIGETRVKDYTEDGSRISISGEMDYSLLDMRSLQTLQNRRFNKQLESDNTRGALSGLYSEFSRVLAEEYFK
jgi:hypothetical protein